jgi:isopentenyl diphosphate isomerase/L-lactate dehydrogenase-like FMN-dependent dehydrogenase
MSTTLKQLNNAYAKRLRQLNKDILNITTNAGLPAFVEGLKYMRDAYIVMQKSTDAIATLNAAIEEFEAYSKTKKEFHWNNFCEFVKLNMKEWLAANDSV